MAEFQLPETSLVAYIVLSFWLLCLYQHIQFWHFSHWLDGREDAGAQSNGHLILYCVASKLDTLKKGTVIVSVKGPNFPTFIHTSCYTIVLYEMSPKWWSVIPNSLPKVPEYLFIGPLPGPLPVIVCPYIWLFLHLIGHSRCSSPYFGLVRW